MRPPALRPAVLSPAVARSAWSTPLALHHRHGPRRIVPPARCRRSVSGIATGSGSGSTSLAPRWGESYFDEVAGELSSRQRVAFSALVELLLESNAMYNLTSAKFSRQDIYAKHFADAATMLPMVRDCMQGEQTSHSLVDIGTGAGFPGMALSLLLNEGDDSLPVTLLDATAKKGKFHELCIGHPGPLGQLLDGTTSTIARAEDFGAPGSVGRGRFSIATARAVAELSVVAEYALPLLRLGGTFLASKGTEENLQLGTAAIEELGGRVMRVEEVVAGKVVVVVEKVRETPERYPRRTGVPCKRPLSKQSLPPPKL